MYRSFLSQSALLRKCLVLKELPLNNYILPHVWKLVAHLEHSPTSVMVVSRVEDIAFCHGALAARGTAFDVTALLVFNHKEYALEAGLSKHLPSVRLAENIDINTTFCSVANLRNGEDYEKRSDIRTGNLCFERVLKHKSTIADDVLITVGEREKVLWEKNWPDRRYISPPLWKCIILRNGDSRIPWMVGLRRWRGRIDLMEGGYRLKEFKKNMWGRKNTLGRSDMAEFRYDGRPRKKRLLQGRYNLSGERHSGNTQRKKRQNTVWKADKSFTFQYDNVSEASLSTSGIFTRESLTSEDVYPRHTNIEHAPVYNDNIDMKDDKGDCEAKDISDRVCPSLICSPVHSSPACLSSSESSDGTKSTSSTCSTCSTSSSSSSSSSHSSTSSSSSSSTAVVYSPRCESDFNDECDSDIIELLCDIENDDRTQCDGNNSAEQKGDKDICESQTQFISDNVDSNKEYTCQELTDIDSDADSYLSENECWL